MPRLNHHPSLIWKQWENMCQKHPRKILLIESETESRFNAARLSLAIDELIKSFPRNLHGKIVAMSIPNSPSWLLTFLALQKTGSIPLILDHTLSQEAAIATAKTLGAHFLYQNNQLYFVSSHSQIPRGIACIKVTSGTTGKLKPVPVTGEELLADGRQIIQTIRFKPEDRNLALIPMGHAYGLGNLVLPLILQSTSLISAKEFVPRQIPFLIRKFKITLLSGVPAIFRIMNSLEGMNSLRPLRIVVSAGAFLSPETALDFHQKYRLKIHNFYGSSETGAMTYDRTGKAAWTGGGVGKPVKGVKIRINSQGQIVASSPAIAQRISESQHTFTLPDLGQIKSNGEIFLLGRLGSIANIGGKKVHPAEVESHIRRIAGVSDVWVTAFQDPRRGDYLAAAVETRISRSEIERKLMNAIPTWKIPKHYWIHPTLPRNPRGKLNITQLRDLLQPVQSHSVQSLPSS